MRLGDWMPNSLLISNCPYIRILTVSIWAIKTSRVSMSPCLITRRYLSLPGNHREASKSQRTITRLLRQPFRFLWQIRLRVLELGLLIWPWTKKFWRQRLIMPEAIFRSLCGSSLPLEKRCTMKGIRDNQRMLNGKPVARSMATRWM